MQIHDIRLDLAKLIAWQSSVNYSSNYTLVYIPTQVTGLEAYWYAKYMSTPDYGR